MKIQNDAVNTPLPVSSDTGKIARKEDASGAQAGSKVTAADSATTSAIADHLQTDPARLDRLREAVRNGTYSIPSLEISARLIDEHLDDTRYA